MAERLWICVLCAVFLLTNISAQECLNVYTAYIVLDGSESMGSANFGTLKQSVNNFVGENLNKNPNNRIGVIVYSDKVTENITATSNRGELQAAINSISYPNGGTATQFALASATAHLLEDPFENTKIMIVITDGLSGQPSLTAAAAESAKRKGILVYAVGLTATLKDFEEHAKSFNDELRSIASNNTEPYIIDNFTGLEELLYNVSSALCAPVVSIINPMKDRTVLEGSDVRMSTTLNQAGITDGGWIYKGGSLTADARYNTGSAGRLQFLDIADVRLNDGGSYRYAYSTATSGAVLTVLSLMENKTAQIGATIHFDTRVTPIGTEGMWLKNNAPLSTMNGKYRIEMLSNGLRRLTIKNFTSDDTGNYAFRVNNVDTSAFIELADCAGVYTAYIVLDGSESMNIVNFDTAKTALNKFVDNSLNQNNRIGVIVYSDKVTTNITATSNREELKDLITNVQYPDGGTATHLGIASATAHLLEDPFENTKIMIVITDGLSSQPTRTAAAAEFAKSKGIIVYAVGLTETVKNYEDYLQQFNDELRSIASHNTDIYTIDNFNELSALLAIASRALCNNAVSIISPMKDRTVLEGSNVTISTTLNQAGITDGGWTYGGGGLSSDTRYDVGLAGGVQYLDITDVRLSDGGSYHYTYTTASSGAVLTVLSLMDNQTANVGDTIQFTTRVSPSDTDGMWLKDDAPLYSLNGKYTIEVLNQGFHRLTIHDADASDAGKYTFVVNDVDTSAFLRQLAIDGGWTAFGDWQPAHSCHGTCGPVHRLWIRQRTCTNPTPTSGGNLCFGESQEIETRPCENIPDCPVSTVDGNWGAWSPWDEPLCPVTCGGGNIVRSRTRQCDNPAPSSGGFCADPTTNVQREIVRCNKDPCPAINGGWTPYGRWRPEARCQATCGQTTQVWIRERSCTNPAPSLGGLICTGQSHERQTRTCAESPECPVDGIWGLWEEWSELCRAQTCGTFPGRRVRQRECDSPAPQAGGDFCEGERFETETFQCNKTACDVDGEWGPWTNWATSDCQSTCGEGVRVRTRDRLCDSPEPKGNGLACFGDSDESDTETCYNKPCPIDGNWSAWTPWAGDECPVCGGGTVRRTRTRQCNNPRPFLGGVDCRGDNFEEKTLTCTTDACPVDGGEGLWSEWVNESTCSATCGDTDSSYMRKRRRECNEPAPSSGGSYCRLKLEERQQISCGYNPCPIDGGFSEWGAWGPPRCDEWFCGRDREAPSLRFRTCDNPSPAYEGRYCEGSPMETAMKSCNFRRDCPVDGSWTEWGEWRNFTCSQTCGRGTLFRTKTRVCIGVRNGGHYCQGSDTETESIECEINKCPVDGNWGCWSAWTEPACPVTCGGGGIVRERSRQCDSPAPSNGGAMCALSNVQSENITCNNIPCHGCQTYTAMIVLDGSESIRAGNFLTIKSVLQSFSGQAISQNSLIKIGVVVFSDEVTQVIAATSDVESLSTAVGDITYPNSGTATHLGVEAARELLLKEDSGTRKVMIVLTDGFSKQMIKTHTAANEAKADNITIVVIGVTESLTSELKPQFDTELNNMATSGHLFTSESFDSLSNVTESVLRQLCDSPLWSMWGPWSETPCPVTCGKDAVRPSTRTRTCLSGSQPTSDCRGPSLEEGLLLCGLTSECPDGCPDFTAIIVLDGSESIRAGNFLTIKSVLQSFTRQAISQNSLIKIGVVVFSDEVTQVITATSDVESLLTAIEDITYPNSGTATYLGLEAATKLLREEDPKRMKVMIVLTDGFSSEPIKTQTAANGAKSDNITVVVIGVTESLTSKLRPQFDAELNNMATSGYLFISGSFDSLSNVLSDVLQRLCDSPMWSMWGPWSDTACPVTCGPEAVRPSTRTRTCLSGSPSTTDCRGPTSEERHQSCGLTSECPVGPARYTKEIVGATIGAGLLLFIIVCFVCVCLYKSRKRRKQQEGLESVDTDAAKRSGVYADRVYQSQMTLNTSSRQDPLRASSTNTDML